jgi:diadenosine tetraphosphate (Ap4A) HIT family hydrolase
MTRYIKFITSTVMDSLRFYNTVRELSQLNDRELADLGLTRNDIVRVASNQYQRDIINTNVNA